MSLLSYSSTSAPVRETPADQSERSDQASKILAPERTIEQLKHQAELAKPQQEILEFKRHAQPDGIEPLRQDLSATTRPVNVLIDNDNRVDDFDTYVPGRSSKEPGPAPFPAHHDSSIKLDTSSTNTPIASAIIEKINQEPRTPPKISQMFSKNNGLSVSRFMMKVTEALQDAGYSEEQDGKQRWIELIMSNIEPAERTLLRHRRCHLLSVNNFWRALTSYFEMAHDESSCDLHLERSKLMSAQTPSNCTDVMAAITERSPTYVSIIVAENFDKLDGVIPFNMMDLFEWPTHMNMATEANVIGNEYIRLIMKTAPAIVQPHLEVLKSMTPTQHNDAESKIKSIFAFEDKVRALVEKSIATAKASGVFTIQSGARDPGTSLSGADVQGGAGLQPPGGKRTPPHPCMFCAGDHWNGDCPNHPGSDWKKTWQPTCTVCESLGGFKNAKIKSSKRLTAEMLKTGHVMRHITANHELALADFNRTKFFRPKDK